MVYDVVFTDAETMNEIPGKIQFPSAVYGKFRRELNSKRTYYIHAIKGTNLDKFCKAVGAKKLEQFVNKGTGNTIVFYSLRK